MVDTLLSEGVLLQLVYKNVSCIAGDDSDAESVDDPSEWEPDPIETTSGRPTLKRQTQDFFAFFVNMFGSKEKFIQELYVVRTALLDVGSHMTLGRM